MTPPRPFRLGVNYWPADFAMGFWQRWDGEALCRDFSCIKSAGLDSVRIFLTWEDFQPKVGVVDSTMLARLTETLHAASRCGLMVMPTLFTGHMSGANWLPAWAIERSKAPSRFPVVCGGRAVSATAKNWYADEGLRNEQARLASECARALAGHPSLLAWDLGNENSNCAVPESRASARAWLHMITEAIRQQDPTSLITLGLHMEDLEEDRHLTPGDAAEVCDFLTMHGYPGYASFAAGPTDERLVPFLAQLTRFLGHGKEVFFSEFGVPTQSPSSSSSQQSRPHAQENPQLVSEQEAASYVARTLRGLRSAGASGAMLWCYSDYSPKLFGEPPFDRAVHERSFGIFRADGSAKPVARSLSSFSRLQPLVEARENVASSGFIDLSIDDYYKSPGRNLRRLFERYCATLLRPMPVNR